MILKILATIYLLLGCILGAILDSKHKFKSKYCVNGTAKYFYAFIFAWTYPITYFIFIDLGDEQ